MSYDFRNQWFCLVYSLLHGASMGGSRAGLSSGSSHQPLTSLRSPPCPRHIFEPELREEASPAGIIHKLFSEGWIRQVDVSVYIGNTISPDGRFGGTKEAM